MKIDFAAKVEIGMRETNDDRILISNRILDMNSDSGELRVPSIAVLCDGCGGYNGGGIAAQTVLEILEKENPADFEIINYLSEVLEKSKKAINETKTKMPSYSKMCTTVVGCVFLQNSIIIFHAGDSRVYRFDGWLAKMTVDHSAVQDLIDLGQVSIDEAHNSPNRNIITRCIGAECEPPEIYVSGVPIEQGDMYILCSDGLWDFLSFEEMESILSSDSSIAEMVNKLIDTALKNGSDDNISVCICAAQEDK